MEVRGQPEEEETESVQDDLLRVGVEVPAPLAGGMGDRETAIV